ncbi:MAG: toxin-antitoxin system YwqK family antitoxin [Phycisphaerae bacterium]
MRVRHHRHGKTTPMWLLLCALVGCHAADHVEQTRFANGRLKSRVAKKVLADGSTVRDGDFRSWFSNGRLHEAGRYVNGQMDGTWTIYDEQGRKRGIQHYVLGRRHGRWLAWHANGRLARQWAYDHGLKHGDWITWDENGKVIQRERYSRGIPQP